MGLRDEGGYLRGELRLAFFLENRRELRGDLRELEYVEKHRKWTEKIVGRLCSVVCQGREGKLLDAWHSVLNMQKPQTRHERLSLLMDSTDGVSGR